MKFNRSIDELKAVASYFWPAELSRQEAEASIIPKLLETQEDFISILSVPIARIEDLFRIVETSTLPGNLFLKHLVVLADFGGEMLQRINSTFRAKFQDGILHYSRDGQSFEYRFKRLPISNLTNDHLGLTGKRLVEKQALSDLHEDVIALLCLGSEASDEGLASILEKCEIGRYFGQRDKIDKFLRQRYIWVSRVTGGAKANELGQIVQNYVCNHLKNNLPEQIAIRANHHIPGVQHTDTDTETTFDLVLTDGRRYVAVEISFQVTTNSTIERKAGQAQSRYAQIHEQGNKIAYVIDGAGNFQRQNATSTLCRFSHCTVAFSKSELGVLLEFMKAFFRVKN